MDALTQQTSARSTTGRSRGISFRSDRSGGSQGKIQDSPREKERRDSIWKLQSKANPNAALREEQPAVKNVLEDTTLQNIREVQHKDASGNVIVEPDLSNPTRPRFERPLDTIRSFERAIDDGYKRRSSFNRAESYEGNNQYASRRSSYFGGLDNGNQNRYSTAGGGGYYGGQRPDSYANGGQSRQRYSQRMQSDPALYGNGQNRSSPQHGYHQSYDTVNTGVTNGSDSTGPWANSTDPSSENSSIDRNMAMNKPSTPGDGYGPYGGHNSHGPIMEEQGQGEYNNRQHGGIFNQQNQHWRQQQQYQQGPPPPPPHAGNSGRRPIPLTSSGTGVPGGSLPSNRQDYGQETEKRKSWLKRTFSKNK